MKRTRTDITTRLFAGLLFLAGLLSAGAAYSQTVSIAADTAANIVPGNNATFTITITGTTTGESTVTWDVDPASAAHELFFGTTQYPAGTVTVPAGTNPTATLSIPIVGYKDITRGGAYTVRLRTVTYPGDTDATSLTATANGSISATANFVLRRTLPAARRARVGEDDATAVTFSVTYNGTAALSTATDVTWTVAAAAADAPGDALPAVAADFDDNADGTANTAFPTGTLTFAANTATGTAQTFSVNLLDDQLYERADEYFTVAIAAASFSGGYTAPVSLINVIRPSDPPRNITLRFKPPTVRPTADGADFQIAESGGNISLCVEMSNPPAATAIGDSTVSVQLSTSLATDITGGGGAEAADFTAVDQALAFDNDNRERCVTVAITDDVSPEPTEYFSANLAITDTAIANVTFEDAAAIIAITDADPISIGFVQTAYSVSEGESVNLVFGVTAPAPGVVIERPFSVDVDLASVILSGNTAAAADFTAFSETDVAITNAAPRLTRTIVITQEDDEEGDETFTVNITADNVPDLVTLDATPAVVTIRGGDTHVFLAEADPNSRFINFFRTVAEKDTGADAIDFVYETTAALPVGTEVTFTIHGVGVVAQGGMFGRAEPQDIENDAGPATHFPIIIVDTVAAGDAIARGAARKRVVSGYRVAQDNLLEGGEILVVSIVSVNIDDAILRTPLTHRALGGGFFDFRIAADPNDAVTIAAPTRETAATVFEGEQIVYSVNLSGGVTTAAMGITFARSGTSEAADISAAAPTGTMLVIPAGQNTGTITLTTAADTDLANDADTIGIDLTASSGGAGDFTTNRYGASVQFTGGAVTVSSPLTTISEVGTGQARATFVATAAAIAEPGGNGDTASIDAIAAGANASAINLHYHHPDGTALTAATAVRVRIVPAGSASGGTGLNPIEHNSANGQSDSPPASVGDIWRFRRGPAAVGFDPSGAGQGFPTAAQLANTSGNGTIVRTTAAGTTTFAAATASCGSLTSATAGTACTGGSTISLALQPAPDGLNEGTEYFWVYVVPAAGRAGPPLLVSITDHADDAITASIALADSVTDRDTDAAGTQVNEGDVLTFVVSLAGGIPSADVEIDYDISGIVAHSNTDYTVRERGDATAFDETNGEGTLTIAAGQTSGEIVLVVNADNVVEIPETLTITLPDTDGGREPDTAGAISVGSNAAATVTIQMKPGEAEISLTGGSTTETNADQTGVTLFTLRLHRAGHPGALMTAGQSITLDATPTFSGVASGANTWELGTPTTGITVAPNGPVQFNSAFTGSGDIVGTIHGDTFNEADQSITLAIDTIRAVGEPSFTAITIPDGGLTAVHRIVDNDPLSLTIAISDRDLNEGDDATISVTPVGGMPASGTLTVAWQVVTTADPADDDVEPADFGDGTAPSLPSGSLTFSTIAAQNVTIATYDDSVADGDEYFSVDFTITNTGDGGGYTEVVAADTTFRIDAGNDQQRAFSLACPSNTAEGNAFTCTVTYTAAAGDLGEDSVGSALTTAAQLTASLTYTGAVNPYTDATAADFNFAGGRNQEQTVTFRHATIPGDTQEVSFNIAADTRNEAREYFTVSLGGLDADEGIDNAYLDDTSAVAFIVADAPIVWSIADAAALEADATAGSPARVYVEVTPTPAITNVNQIGSNNAGIVFNFSVPSGGSATDGSDYNVLSFSPATLDLNDFAAGRVATGGTAQNPTYTNIAACEFKLCIAVDVLHDVGNEGTEVVPLRVDSITSAQANLAVADNGRNAAVAITDNDTLSISIADAAAVDEGGDLEFTVSFGGALTQPLTVVYDLSGTGVTADDFTGGGLSGRSINFPAGAATSGSLSLDVSRDAAAESAETVTVTITSIAGGGGGRVELAGGAGRIATGDINASTEDARALQVTHANLSAGVLSVTETNADQTITLAVNLRNADDTAAATGNGLFTAATMIEMSANTSGMSGEPNDFSLGTALSCPANNASCGNITFTVVGDQRNEPQDEFTITFRAAGDSVGRDEGTVPVTITVRIADNDTITWSISPNATVTEGDPGDAPTSHTFTLTLSGATSGEAYLLRYTYEVLPAGTTAEADDYSLPLRPAIAGQFFELNTVQWDLREQVAQDGTVTMPSLTRDVVIYVTNDDLNEGDETLALRFNTASFLQGINCFGCGTVTVADVERTLTITDDDAITVSVAVVTPDQATATGHQVEEGGNVVFRVTAASPPGSDLTVPFTVGGDTAVTNADYDIEEPGSIAATATGASVTIAAGETSALIVLSLDANEDGSDSPDNLANDAAETLTVTLTPDDAATTGTDEGPTLATDMGAVGVAASPNNAASTSVVNGAASRHMTLINNIGSSGFTENDADAGKSITFTIGLTAGDSVYSNTQTVNWTINHITTEDADFTCTGASCTATSGSTTFPMGAVAGSTAIKTFTISVAGDNINEANEQFTLSISTTASATVVPEPLLVTIQDDDDITYWLDTSISGTGTRTHAETDADTTFTIIAAISGASEGAVRVKVMEVPSPNGQFGLIRNPVTTTMTVGAPADAPVGTDFTVNDTATDAFEDGFIVIDAGDTSALLTVTVHGDEFNERTDQLIFTAANIGGDGTIADSGRGVTRNTVSAHTITVDVTDDDTITFSLTADQTATAYIGDVISFTVGADHDIPIEGWVEIATTLNSPTGTTLTDISPGLTTTAGTYRITPDPESQKLRFRVSATPGMTPVAQMATLTLDSISRQVTALGNTDIDTSNNSATTPVDASIAAHRFTFSNPSTSTVEWPNSSGNFDRTFTVSRAGRALLPGEAVVVSATVILGTADAADFVNGRIPSAILTFSGTGQSATTQRFDIVTVPDNLHDFNETFTIALSSIGDPVGGASFPAPHSVTINDAAEDAIVVSLGADTTVAEADGVQAVVTLSGGIHTGPVSVEFQIYGTANRISETASPLIIPVGQTSGVINVVTADNVNEPDGQTVIVETVPGSRPLPIHPANTQTFTLTDSNPLFAHLELSLPVSRDSGISEGAGTDSIAEFTITLREGASAATAAGTSAADICIPFTTSVAPQRLPANNALSGADIALIAPNNMTCAPAAAMAVMAADGGTTASLTIPAGMSSGKFEVRALFDDLNEGAAEEILSVQLGAAEGSGIGSVTTAASVSVPIVDRDAARNITATGPLLHVDEGGMMTFTISVDGSPVSDAFDVTWTITAGTAQTTGAGADVSGTMSGTVNFGVSTQRVQSRTVSLAVVQDDLPEDAETVRLTLTDLCGTVDDDACGFGGRPSTFSASAPAVNVSPLAAIGTVAESDRPVTLAVTAPAADLTEGTAGQFSVGFPESVTTTEAVTFDWAITPATAGGVTPTQPGDFATANGSGTIPAGAQSVMLDITPANDPLNEGAESFVVTISNPAGGGGIAAPVLHATPTATAQIESSDPVVVTITGPTQAVSEGGDAVFTVGLILQGTTNTAATSDGDICVTYRTAIGTQNNPSGMENTDANADIAVLDRCVSPAAAVTVAADGSSTDGRVRIPAGSSSAPLSVEARYDDLAETANEVLTVTLNSTDRANAIVTSGTNSATANIANVTAARTMSIMDAAAVNEDSTIERTPRTTPPTFMPTAGLEFTVTVAGSVAIESAISVDWSVTDNAADLATTVTSGTLTFAPGAVPMSQTITLAVLDDTDAESDEAVIITLSDPCPASGVCAVGGRTGVALATTPALVLVDASGSGTINQSDQPIRISISPLNSPASEESEMAQFTVRFDELITTTAPVTFSFVNLVSEGIGSVSNTDFTANGLLGNGMIPAGASTVTLNVPLMDDAINEGEESFTIRLSSVAGGGAVASPVLSTAEAVGVIAASDPAEVAITAPIGEQRETTNADFTVNLRAVGGGEAVVSEDAVCITFRTRIATQSPSDDGLMNTADNPDIGVSNGCETAAVMVDASGRATGKVLLAAGESSVTLPIFLSYDNINETMNERLTVALTSAAHQRADAGTSNISVAATARSGAVDIVNVNALRVIQARALAANRNEDSGEVLFEVVLESEENHRLLSSISVDWTAIDPRNNPPGGGVSNGNSVNNHDGGGAHEFHGPTSGRVTFHAGESLPAHRTVPVRVADDAYNEGDETVTLRLTDPCPPFTPGQVCEVGGRPAGDDINAQSPTVALAADRANVTIRASDPVTVSIEEHPDQPAVLLAGQNAVYVMRFGTTDVNGRKVPVVTTTDLTVMLGVAAGASPERMVAAGCEAVGSDGMPIVVKPVSAGRSECKVVLTAAEIGTQGNDRVDLRVRVADVSGEMGNPATFDRMQTLTSQVRGWTVSVTANRTRVTEDNAVEFTITLGGELSALTGGVDVAWAVAGTGITAEDFDGAMSGTVEFRHCPVNDMTCSNKTRVVTLNIARNDDNAAGETGPTDDEVFTFTITPGGADGGNTGVIGDPLRITIAEDDPEARRARMQTISAAMTRAIATSADSLISRRFDAVRSGGGADSGNFTIGGQAVSNAGDADFTAATGAWAANPFERGRMRDTHSVSGGQSMSMSEVLRGSSFSLFGIGSGNTNLWAANETLNYKSTGGNTTYDGDNTSAHFGADALCNYGDCVTGMSIAYTSGDVNFTDKDVGISGTVKASITSVHPYYARWVSDDMFWWLTAGYGIGDVTINEPNDSGTTSANVQMLTGGLSGTATVGDSADFVLRLRGQWTYSVLAAKVFDSGSRLPRTTATTVRLGGEWEAGYNYDYASGNARLYGNLGARRDFRDARDNIAYDAGAGVQWQGDSGYTFGFAITTQVSGPNTEEDRYSTEASWKSNLGGFGVTPFAQLNVGGGNADWSGGLRFDGPGARLNFALETNAAGGSLFSGEWRF